MIIPTLMQAVKPNVDKGDLFMSRFLLVFALLVATFLIGYLLIILAKRVIVVINAFSAPSKLASTQGKRFQAATDSRDPWAESANRMNPGVFMPGSNDNQGHGQRDDSGGHGGHGEDHGHRRDHGHGHGHGNGPMHRDDLGSHHNDPGTGGDTGPSDSGPSDSGGGGGSDSGPSDSGGGSSGGDSGGGGGSSDSNT